MDRLRRKPLDHGHAPAQDAEQRAELPYEQDGSGECVARLTRLQNALTTCPTDMSARGHLAALLEQLGQHEEALFNWSAVLDHDPGCLKAREGVARCRQRSGRPLQC